MIKVYKEISELKQGARQACEAHIKACKDAGLDIIITETYRSQERQDSLYAQGRAKPGKIVTWTKHSNHSGRQAWDICFKSTGYDELSKFYKAGDIAESLGITWGGSWKTPDYPHFQYTGDTYMVPTTYKEAEDLVNRAYDKGIITDKQLWYEYMVGKKALTPGNLRALFSKILMKL